MLHGLLLGNGSQNTPCGTRRTRTRAGELHSLMSGQRTLGARGLRSAALINQRGRRHLSLAVDPPQQQISCTCCGDKGPGGDAHNVLELVGLVVVSAPAEYTRDM